MKTFLKYLGLEGILRLENKSIGWIEASDFRRFELINLISNDEIMRDLNYGVK
jgi:hypothetical protein